MFHRLLVLGPLALGLFPPAAAAQLSRTMTVTVGRQMTLGAGAGLTRQWAPSDSGPSPLGARALLLGRAGITGSRDLSLSFDAPARFGDWRFYALARSERLMRTPYFGIDNGARQDDSLIDAHGSTYYRHALLRATARGVVQRRVAGPLWLHLAAQVRRYRTSSLRQQPTLHQRDMAAAGLPDTQRFSAAEGATGLVWDTRTDWVTPSGGLRLEALFATGRLTGGMLTEPLSYQRLLLSAREYLRLDAARRTILALRQGVSLASDTLPFFLAYEQLSAWAPEDGVVGSRSIRLHGGGAQLASNRAWISVDVRRILIPPDWPERERRLWGTAFVDFGVLWEPRQAATLRRREWTAGAGFRVQLGRTFLSGADLGITNTGPSVSVVSQFAY